MKVEKTLYIINGKLIDILPKDYEGQYIDIDIEIKFYNQVEECHGVHNICSFEFEVTSIYVMSLEYGSKKLICDITDNFQDIVFELIQKTNLIF